MCDCCNQYEINKCQEYNAKSMKISQLKAQIAQLDDNDRAYNALLQKYCQLQNEYQLLNDSKIHFTSLSTVNTMRFGSKLVPVCFKIKIDCSITLIVIFILPLPIFLSF